MNSKSKDYRKVLKVSGKLLREISDHFDDSKNLSVKDIRNLSEALNDINKSVQIMTRLIAVIENQ